jgi:hypothetical protein
MTYYHPEYDCSICCNQEKVINHHKYPCDYIPNPLKGCPLFKKMTFDPNEDFVDPPPVESKRILLKIIEIIEEPKEK